MQQLFWAGKNKELTVPRVLLLSTFFVRTEMLPVERVVSSLGRYVFGSEISYNKAPPRLPGLGC